MQQQACRYVPSAAKATSYGFLAYAAKVRQYAVQEHLCWYVFSAAKTLSPRTHSHLMYACRKVLSGSAIGRASLQLTVR